MKYLLLTATLLACPAVLYAQPASNVAWTPETLNLVKKGDLNKGKALAESCQSCHGAQGEGVAAETRDGETLAAIPALAGQTGTYLYKQLRDYADGSRSHATMSAIAKGLNEQSAADVAAWFSSLPLPQRPEAGKPSKKVETLVDKGDGKRIVPPCFVCHDSRGRGEKMDIPALAGQQAGYLASTLQAYKSGERHNDIYSRMRLIAQQLTDTEIKELADYYQGLK